MTKGRGGRRRVQGGAPAAGGRAPGGRGPEPAKKRAARKQPYYEGYFGTEEEEGVEREREAPDDDPDARHRA